MESKDESKEEEKKPKISPIFGILQNVRGFCEKSMISMCLPSYLYTKELIRDLEEHEKEAKMNYDLEKSFYSSFSSMSSDFSKPEVPKRTLDDEDLKEAEVKWLVFKEAKEFVAGLRWQDEDKASIGLIIFYGHILDEKGKSKKIFHTFPCPINFVAQIDIQALRRFNTEILKKSEWIVEYFSDK